MSDSAIIILCLIAIIASIIASNIWKLNMGLLAMGCAFIIGCLFQGQKVSTIFGYWPDNIAFFLIACCLFFGFARDNGTLEVFGNKLLWKFRHHTKMIPWVIFLICAILGYLGTGSGTIFIIAPVAYIIGEQIGIDPLLTACAVNMGYVCGGWNPWTGTGVILYGLMEDNGLTSEVATRTYLMAYGGWLIRQFIVFGLAFLYFTFIKKQRNALSKEEQQQAIKEPQPFNVIQRKTFTLIITAVVLIVIPSVLSAWFPIKNALFKNLVKLCKPQAICVIFALIASAMKLGDVKKVISKLPMNTVLMISGICFLMTIATKAGLIKTIADGFSNLSLPNSLISPILALLAGILSIFSSATGVVCPLLFPLVPALSTATGLNPVVLYASIMAGADTTSLSPFSTAGSQLVALAPDSVQEQLIPRQLAMTFIALAIVIILAYLGLFDIMRV